jgi:hypothetical protein
MLNSRFYIYYSVCYGILRIAARDKSETLMRHVVCLAPIMCLICLTNETPRVG